MLNTLSLESTLARLIVRVLGFVTVTPLAIAIVDPSFCTVTDILGTEPLISPRVT